MLYLKSSFSTSLICLQLHTTSYIWKLPQVKTALTFFCLFDLLTTIQLTSLSSPNSFRGILGRHFELFNTHCQSSYTISTNKLPASTVRSARRHYTVLKITKQSQFHTVIKFVLLHLAPLQWRPCPTYHKTSLLKAEFKICYYQD